MMKRFILVIIMMISLFSLSAYKSACAETKTSIVSYYNDAFNGKKTASGEIFDNSKLTAANRVLPFGTKVKLTNLANGENVTVRINDRGPFHSSRALDISKAAFAQLTHLSAGKVAVSYEVVE